MKTLFTESDPTTGLQTEYLYDGRNLTERVTANQAMTKAVLEGNTRLANDPGYAKSGIKNEFQHVARVPSEVWLRWASEGFDIFKAQPKEIIKRIKRESMDKLKVTSGRI